MQQKRTNTNNGIWNRSYCEYQSCRHLGLSGRPRSVDFYSKNNPRVLWLKYRLYRFNFDGRYRYSNNRFGNLQPFLRFHNGGYRLYQKSTIYLHSCRTKRDGLYWRYNSIPSLVRHHLNSLYVRSSYH